jgi:hypothetical protein
MVRPANFGFNSETASSNHFQKHGQESGLAVSAIAKMEFDNMATQLRNIGIHVIVIEDTISPQKPDAIFPNNWITTHKDGSVFLFPMLAPNRRLERRSDIIEILKTDYKVSKVVDISHTEKDNRFLEGTGSIVFDHQHKTAFACISERTERDLFTYYCHEIGYKSIHFRATDSNQKEIYHTNVMMCMGEEFGIVCLESIENDLEKKLIISHFEEHDKEMIIITREQMNQFAGNMIELRSNNGYNVLLQSQTAFNALTTKQKESLKKYVQLHPIQINTIESIGGGSVRCMVAEIFLPKNSTL